MPKTLPNETPCSLFAKVAPLKFTLGKVHRTPESPPKQTHIHSPAPCSLHSNLPQPTSLHPNLPGPPLHRTPESPPPNTYSTQSSPCVPTLSQPPSLLPQPSWPSPATSGEQNPQLRQVAIVKLRFKARSFFLVAASKQVVTLSHEPLSHVLHQVRVVRGRHGWQKGLGRVGLGGGVGGARVRAGVEAYLLVNPASLSQACWGGVREFHSFPRSGRLPTSTPTTSVVCPTPASSASVLAQKK